MNYLNSIYELSIDDMVQIDGGKLNLPGWLGVLSFGYDFIHGFYDGIRGE